MNAVKLPRERYCEAEGLWMYCFGDSAEFTRWYFEKRTGGIYVMESGGEIITQIVTVPVDFDIRGAKKRGVLLSGIATAPKHRLKGHMGALLPECLSLLRESGADFAGLYPFDYSFYEHYGFAQSSDIIRARASIARLPKARIAGDFVRAEGEGGAAMLNQAYETCFSGCSGRVLRGAAGFARRLEELENEGGHAMAYIGENGDIQGYLLYVIEGREIKVWEIAGSNHAARMDLLAYLGAHSTTADSVSWSEENHNPLWRLLADPRGAAAIEPFAMNRILCVESALDGIPCGEGSVVLRIVDLKSPENTDNWRIFNENGNLCAKRAKGVPECGLSINELTQWVIGYKTASFLRENGALLNEKTAAVMDMMLPPARTFTYDMY